MARVAHYVWRTPPPTSVDEQLVVYDDGTAWLVVRSPRVSSAAIGSYLCRPNDTERELLSSPGAQPVQIDLLATEQPFEALFPVLDRVCAEAMEHPQAVATFHGHIVDNPASNRPSVALLAVGSGVRAVQFELNPASCSVHFSRGGQPLAWREFPELQAGFVTTSAKGLGGVHRVAIIEPEAFGAISFTADVPEGADHVAVEVRGWLSAALPDEETPEPFAVRTDTTPIQ